MWATIETAFGGGLIMGAAFLGGGAATGLCLAILAEILGAFGYGWDLEHPFTYALCAVGGLMMQGHVLMNDDWRKR